MKSGKRCLVYYSIYLDPAGASYESILTAHITSVGSLRKTNPSIPVWLISWGNRLDEKDVRRIEDLGVEIHYLGKHDTRLEHLLPTGWPDVLARNPSGSRWLLSLPHILSGDFDQILYVDNDTYFMDDAEELFSRCLGSDIYAREEPLTRKSHLGYDPGYIDQRALDELVRSEGLNPIIPFNTGVVLLKRETADWLAAHTGLVFSYFVRFTMWAAQHPDPSGDLAFVEAARGPGLATTAGFDPLPYPSRNRWIIEQFALWFALASAAFKLQLFPRAAVVQASEYSELQGPEQKPCLIHYYSSNAKHFLGEWLPSSAEIFQPVPASETEEHGQQITVSLLLRDGYRRRVTLAVSDPSLRSLFEVVGQRYDEQLQSTVFNLELEQGEGSLIFAARDLVALSTDPAVSIDLELS